MKTPEDEAFEDIERRQGGGFPAKRAMAADKLHWSDCAVHNAPAYLAGACDCGVEKGQEEDWGALAEKQLASIKRDTRASFEDAMVCATHKVMAEFEAQPPLPVQEPPQNHVWRVSNKVAAFYFWSEDAARKAATSSGATWMHVTPVSLVDVAQPPLPVQPVQREWVGLTDEDRKATLLTAYKEWECEELLLCAREDYLLIEQALKEKNT